MSTPTTSISSETMDLSDLFPVSEETTPTSTVLDKESTSIDIDEDDEPEVKPVDKVEDKAGEKPAAEPVVEKVVPRATSTETPQLEELNESFEEAKGGTKADLVDFFKTKIESGELVAFDDFDESKQTLTEYLKTFKPADFDQLWKDNTVAKETALAAKLPKEFFDTLPEELQYAAQYVADGGTDMKSLFKALAQVEEVKALDPKTDSRALVEQYLVAKKMFATPEELKEQLDEWDDLNVLGKKAEKFKPELDKMQTEILEGKIAAQAQIKEKQQEQYNFYHDNVYEALRKEDLGGLKINKAVQVDLYNGLTQNTFKDSRGKQTTEFEYLLDQIMWVKPDYEKLAKIHWLLRDEAGYEKALSTKAVNANVEENIRTLKTEQAKRQSATPDSPAPAKNTIPRGGGLFSRK